MLKKILSPRNIIFFVIIAAFVAVIAGQQSVLNQKKQDYSNAKAEEAEIAGLWQELELKKETSKTDISEEERARQFGYIMQGDYIFDYPD